MASGMILSSRSIITMVLCSFLVVACIQPTSNPGGTVRDEPPTTVALTEETSTEQLMLGEEIATVTFVEGEVLLEEPTSSLRVPGLAALIAQQGRRVQPFTRVRIGSTVAVGNGGRVTLVGDNNHVVQGRSGDRIVVQEATLSQGQPLPGTGSTYVNPGSSGRIRVNQGTLVLEGESRDRPGDYGRIPVILSPRNTGLIELAPTIQWVAVTGAIEYVLTLSSASPFDAITLKTDELTCREDQRVVTNTVCTVSWPATWQLESGKRYFLQVSARTGIAAQLRHSERSALRTLDAESANQIEQAKTELASLALDAVTHNLLLAGMLAEQGVRADNVRFGLYAQAIPLYEQLVATNPAPVLYVTLGDAYRAIDLGNYAFFAYQAAVDQLNVTGDDPTVRAAAEFGMGYVEYSWDHYANAEPHFLQAYELYSNLDAEAELAAASFALGRIEDSRCDVTGAEEYYIQAGELYAKLDDQAQLEEVQKALEKMTVRCANA